MKINKITSYVNKGLSHVAGGTQMSSNTSKLDKIMQEIIDTVKSPDNKILISLSNLVDAGKLERVKGNLFKHKDFHILTLFKDDGAAYSKKLKQLTELDLGITQRHVETIEQDGIYCIITKVPGIQNGELVPLWQKGNKAIPKENRIKAFQDLQKLTKAGFVDDTVLQSDGMWFVNPQNEIVIPVFDRLRTIRPDESRKEILEKYYQILFK